MHDMGTRLVIQLQYKNWRREQPGNEASCRAQKRRETKIGHSVMHLKVSLLVAKNFRCELSQHDVAC